MSVSAFSADFLEKQSVQESLQIARFTPNLLITRSPGHLSSASVIIRGIGQRTNDALTDPGVGMYLDGVYIARVSGALQDLVDPARIEVLARPAGHALWPQHHRRRGADHHP